MDKLEIITNDYIGGEGRKRQRSEKSELVRARNRVKAALTSTTTHCDTLLSFVPYLCVSVSP